MTEGKKKTYTTNTVIKKVGGRREGSMDVRRQAFYFCTVFLFPDIFKTWNDPFWCSFDNAYENICFFLNVVARLQEVVNCG